MRPPFFRVDFEAANRCNADCSFCPRHMTPHEGLMSPETFEHAFNRTVEFRDLTLEHLEMDVGVTFCGLGEPLLNPRLPEWVARVRGADMMANIASNGAILDERRGRALLDAGLQQVLLNVGARGDAYEEIYKLPWERTRDNVLRFNEMAGDDCAVFIVLVDHADDPDAQEREKEFWRGEGVKKFLNFDIMNRGGSLFVDHMQFEQYPEMEEAKERFAQAEGEPACFVPFVVPFVGYDGNYYLCCSDWTKEAEFGHVKDVAIADLLKAKLEHTQSRRSPCHTCNVDPVNYLTQELRAEATGQAAAGHSDTVINQMIGAGNEVARIIETLGPFINHIDPIDRTVAPGGRQLIPVRAEAPQE